MEKLAKYKKYKPSGIDWIGEVPEHWKVNRLKDNALKTTIKNNLTQDERQVYDLVIKAIMDKLYTDNIINHSPQLYQELTQNDIQGFVNLSAYKMLRTILKITA